MSDPLLSELLKMAKFESHLLVLHQWREAKITILIGGNAEQHMDAFRRRKVSKAESLEYIEYLHNGMKHTSAVVLQPKSRPGAQFVYFPTRPNLTNPEVVGTVAHEVFHVTAQVLRRSEVRLTHASEEAYAYLHDYLMYQFWKKLTPKGTR